MPIPSSRHPLDVQLESDWVMLLILWIPVPVPSSRQPPDQWGSGWVVLLILWNRGRPSRSSVCGCLYFNELEFKGYLPATTATVQTDTLWHWRPPFILSPDCVYHVNERHNQGGHYSSNDQRYEGRMFFSGEGGFAVVGNPGPGVKVRVPKTMTIVCVAWVRVNDGTEK